MLRRPLVFQTLLASVLCCATAASAQQVVPLWEGGAPGFRHARAESVEDKRETGRTDRYFGYVSEPSLTWYPVSDAKQPGPVVLVMPGGGFRYVVIDKEGHEVARWLNAQGIAAAVLKYRTADPDADRSWSTYLPLLALGDTARAVRLLRHHADAWKIDPDRIGLLGFSAGGTMAIQQTIDADRGKAGAADPIDRLSSMPNSIGLIYSTLPDGRLPKILPGVPFFIAHGASDQKATAKISSKLFQSIVDKGGMAELHVFQGAEHGFGVAPASGTARSWPTLYVDWLKAIQAR